MGRKKTIRFIQKAKLKKGALSKQLQIPEKENIPITLLRKINRTQIGKIVKNPTKTGKSRIKVTRLLKRRSVFAETLKTIKRR